MAKKLAYRMDYSVLTGYFVAQAGDTLLETIAYIGKVCPITITAVETNYSTAEAFNVTFVDLRTIGDSSKRYTALVWAQRFTGETIIHIGWNRAEVYRGAEASPVTEGENVLRQIVGETVNP